MCSVYCHLVRFLGFVAVASLLAALIYGATFAWWLDREVIDPNSFVESGEAALAQESSRIAVGQLIVDRLVDEYPLFVFLEANLTTLFSDLLATEALEDARTTVATEIHHRIVSGDQSAVVVDLDGYRALIIEPLEIVAPRLANLVPDDWFVAVEVLEAGVLPDLSSGAKWADEFKWLATVGAAVLMAVVLWGVRPLSTAILLIGASCSLAGLATALLVPGGRWLTLSDIDSESIQVVVANTYDAFTINLVWSAGILCVFGAALIVLGAALWAGERESSREVMNAAA